MLGEVAFDGYAGVHYCDASPIEIQYNNSASIGSIVRAE